MTRACSIRRRCAIFCCSWLQRGLSKPGKAFASHETVNHKNEEYARDDVHVNSAEGNFSIFKRGMTGVYQYCGEQHLHRYLNEFDFRYNARKISDAERAEKAVKGAAGKRSHEA